MKFLLPFNNFVGGFMQSISDALEQSGHQVINSPQYRPEFKSRIIHRIDSHGYLGLRDQIKRERFLEFNNLLVTTAGNFKPDVFFNFSGGGYQPDTIKKLKEEAGLLTMCYIADNPCDPRRDKYFAMSLQYYDVLLYADEAWLKLLNNLAPKAKKIKFFGGYDPKLFFPQKLDSFSQALKETLTYDIVFTGGSYKETGEGGYRAGILGMLAQVGYDVHIWGDKGWDYRKQFYPALENRMHNERLPYKELRALFQLSKVYLNMPSPQILTSFQPRVFEIAAAKGFQIIDHSEELTKIFGDEYVSFKSFDDLKEKIDYYLTRPEERTLMVDKMYNRVKDNYTWTAQLKKVLAQI